MGKGPPMMIIVGILLMVKLTMGANVTCYGSFNDETGYSPICSDIDSTQRDLSLLWIDLESMRAEINVLRNDNLLLKKDQAILRGTFATLRENLEPLWLNYEELYAQGDDTLIMIHALSSKLGVEIPASDKSVGDKSSYDHQIGKAAAKKLRAMNLKYHTKHRVGMLDHMIAAISIVVIWLLARTCCGK